MTPSSAYRLVCTDPGAADGGLQLEKFQLPELGSGEAIVEMLAAPIHPADINSLHGTYGRKRTVPFVPGNEGVGRVLLVGSNAPQELLGKNVLLPYGSGSWTTHILCPADDLIPVPPSVPCVQAAQALVNPLTAMCLLDLAKNSEEKIIAQNAANSAVGLSVAQLANHMGIRTINIVRSQKAASQLKDLSGSAVLIDDTGSLTSKDIQTAANLPIHTAFNAVGGLSGTVLAGALQEGGTLFTYGAMSRQALKIPASFLIFRDIRFQGFWLHKLISTTATSVIRNKIEHILKLMTSAQLTLPTEQCFPLEKFRQAIACAATSGRKGKVLFVNEQ